MARLAAGPDSAVLIDPVRGRDCACCCTASFARARTRRLLARRSPQLFFHGHADARSDAARAAHPGDAHRGAGRADRRRSPRRCSRSMLLMAIIALIGWAIVDGYAYRRRRSICAATASTPRTICSRASTTRRCVCCCAPPTCWCSSITVGAMLMTIPASAPIRHQPAHLGGHRRHCRRPRRAAGAEQSLRRRADRDDAADPHRGWSASWKASSATIEEITSTYVVVRLWDLRRMILPLCYFIEKPFQNWTREPTAMIGAVILHVDYSRPGRSDPRQGGRDREGVAALGRSSV